MIVRTKMFQKRSISFFGTFLLMCTSVILHEICVMHDRNNERGIMIYRK